MGQDDLYQAAISTAIMPDSVHRESVHARHADIFHRASIRSSFRMDPRYQPTGRAEPATTLPLIVLVFFISQYTVN